MDLRAHNINILEQYNTLKHKKDFSIPLLVSSNPIYLNKLKLNKKVFYIGQETNTWMNYSTDEYYSINDIEDKYYDFLKKDCTNKEFWRFLRNCLNNDIIDSTIWSNALLASKRYEKGTPSNSEEIKQLSIDNLIYLYEYFKPEVTIITAGPNNPYYEVITSFLRHINSKLCERYPSSKEMMVSDLDKKIFYTYHPNFLQRRSKLKELSLEIKKYTKKELN